MDVAVNALTSMGSALSGQTGGGSATAHADLRQLEIDLISEQVQALESLKAKLLREADSYRVGGAGEAQVVQVLLDWANTNWFVLADRRWPGTTKANLDAVVVGPGGVFVIDVKTWRDPRVAQGTLWHGQTDEAEQLAKVRDQARDVCDCLIELGYPPSQVTAMIVLAGRTCPAVLVDGVTVVGERDLHQALARLGSRLTQEQVGALVGALDSACPPMPRTRTTGQQSKRPPVNHPDSDSHPEEAQPALLDEEEIFAALAETARAGPIESWMVWLHPSQSVHVGRRFNGPARIRGAAGTGKTVVALHRAKYLAEHTSGKVLVTSFVRNLPAVQRNLFDRLAPGLGQRVEFQSLHQWAAHLLRQRGIPMKVDSEAARTAFNRAWIAVGRGSALDGLAAGPDYWWDEVAAVIKGRGVTEPDAYYELDRLGRRTPLQRSHREIVWQLAQTYETLKSERGVHDWADLLLAARESVQAEAVTGYSAVIVDEVQDLTVVGVQLLHHLVGDRADGLMLVGDGQQSIYVGAYTAAEAGINIRGRSVILKRNYRNAATILARALKVVAGEEYADLARELENGEREVETERAGGVLKEVRADDERSLAAAALIHLDELLATGTRPGDVAVLCSTTAEVDRWIRNLRNHRTPVMALADYDGHAADNVKIGTYHRAKGLEFPQVLIPDLHRTPRPRHPMESDEAYQERAELEHRQLFVAMTRARDGLWLGQVAET